jgi:iron(III) transport system substrate-binding protein
MSFLPRRTARVAFGAALAATALTLAACGSSTTDSASTDATSAPASEATSAAAEGALTVYSGRSEELVAPLFAEFTEATGIPVEARYGDTAELAAQLIEEGANTPAQVYFAQDAGALGALAAEGLLAPLPAAAVGAVPAVYQAQDGTWTGVTGRARVIAYDSEQVAADQVPQSVFELTDPTWKGQVAIAPTNASFQSFVTAMRLSDGDDATKAWLEGLVANEVQTYEKNSLILDAVDADAMRAQLGFTAPKDPGSLVNVAGVGVLAPAADNTAAAEFVTWLLSPEIQQWFVENTYEYPLVEGVAIVDGIPPLSELSGPDVPLADLADLPGTLEMLTEVGLL